METKSTEFESSTQQELERSEFDTVVLALARSPRLERLMVYLGEKYFSDLIDDLNEYNIATEVFGRSKTIFDASKDAIARVEVHRLRKKLKEYYDTTGRDHEIQISLPTGSYIPVFARGSSAFDKILDEQSARYQPLTQESAFDEAPPRNTSANDGLERPTPRRKIWYYLLPALAGVVAIAAFVYFQHERLSHIKTTTAATTEVPNNLPAGVLTGPIRMIAGYSGEPQIDSSGNTWGPEQFVHGGSPWKRPETFIEGTSDPQIFRQWRTGNFSYDIPLAPGTYELHLYFVTPEKADEPFNTFTISINNKISLPNFDINMDALGGNIADERVLREISPDSDGKLHIRFDNESSVPMLSALAILPGTPHKQLPIRIIARNNALTDHQGRIWHADTYFKHGSLANQQKQLITASDSDLFISERFGHFTYSIPVDTRGRYTVILHFAEFYFGRDASGVGGNGSRVFHVFCNGNTLLENFDIYKEAGSLREVTKTFTHIKPSAQGKINLTFEPVINNATVSGIEVIDESE